MGKLSKVGRIKRGWLIGLGGVLLLGAGGLVALSHWLGTDDFRQRAQGLASAALGVPVQMERISLDFRPWPALGIEALVVQPPKAPRSGKAPAPVTVGRLALQPDYLSLLRGDFRLAILHVDLHVLGEPPAQGPLLVVCNHISWLDIFVINALAPSAFVSKAEVRGWPLIGWLAEKNDTVFLRRGSHGHARIINREIAGILDKGNHVAVFPEGTTTDGTHLLHFHAALIQPALAVGRPVLPLAISYWEADGSRSLAPGYVGDVSLMQCTLAIAGCRRLVARVTTCPVLGLAGEDRRDLIARVTPCLSEQDIRMLREAVGRTAGRITLEASGGVNLETVRGIAETGVDVISVGALTHSASVLDIGLDAG